MFDIHTIITLLVSAVAVYVGGLIKKSDASNKIIPWVTLAISLLNQIVQAATGASPASAADSTAVAAVAQHASFLHVFLGILFKTILQTGLITGGVSFVKNGVLGYVSESKTYRS